MRDCSNANGLLLRNQTDRNITIGNFVEKVSLQQRAKFTNYNILYYNIDTLSNKHIIHYLFELDFICGKGYTKKNGKLGGKRSLKSFSTTPYDCRKKCSENPKCKSIAYSAKWRNCKLQKHYEPPYAENYQDYVWCSKGTL